MERNLRRGAVVALVGLLVGAGAVRGGETERGGYELDLSTQTPGASTGLTFHILYKHPDDPEGKPPPVTGAVFDLPPGMRIANDALPQCTASDADFRAQGRQACPEDTHVGGGTLIAMTGAPGADPVTTDVEAYNGDGELIEVVFFEGTNTVAGMDRITIEGEKLTAHPPATPGGPPDGRTAVREIRLELPARTGAAGRHYVTAPPACPAGAWTSRAHYEFEDGGKTTVTSESPCRPDRALAVGVTPRRVRAGTRTTFRIAATSPDPTCADAARVRFGGRRAHTGPRGRARIRTAFARPGRKRVVVSKAGCRTAVAIVRVVARS
ncbi:MAG: hypothetical protein QOJ22_803 [Thermoleophilaceae bacterium]|jgi:hypothetical protein|nr:hypothetical protein [Thermoleophilaceae bacterium]